MKIICYYNRNLKMTAEKLASQVGHVTKELGKTVLSAYGDIFPPEDDIVIVLGLRQNKFNEKLVEVSNKGAYYYTQKDKGLTEVKEGTLTTFGYVTDN